MPFTPAHPAIVLPLLRSRWFSATGLIAGSLSPDFEYFFKMSVDGVHGHTWPGLFYFDLPVSVGLAYLFHLVVKRNLIHSLPLFLQSRFADTLTLRFQKYVLAKPFIFISSILVGATSHIVWDSFTHGTGFSVHYFSFYRGSYFPFDGVNYPLWYALQHISTFVGLTLVFLYVAFMPALKSYLITPHYSYWLRLLLICIAVLSVRFAIQPNAASLGNIVVSAISALCIALVACGLLPLSYSCSDDGVNTF